MDELLKQIGRDLAEPVGYLPFGVLAGVIFWLICQFLKRKFEINIAREKQGVCFFIIVYITILLNITLFSREGGSRDGIALRLFETLNDSIVSQAFFIENVMLFIPMGILFPMGISVFRKGRICILTGFLISICLEMTQLITRRGFCQLDDVVTNTAGTMIGWGIYYLARMEKKKRESKDV